MHFEVVVGADQRYWDQNEFLVAENFLDAATLASMIAEANALRAKINRNYVPGQKKGGSVSAFEVAEHAPVIHALYNSPELIALLSTLTRESLLTCPDGDPHRCALYFYTEQGDHIGGHYDTSFYKGKRYTVLLGLVDQSSSRLVCQLYKNDPSRETEELRVATTPGSMVLFNGDKLWHSVSPLAAGEDRVVLTLQYVTDRRMGRVQRIVSDVKDAVAYFGVKSLFRSRRRG
jgi:hypothetical protein